MSQSFTFVIGTHSRGLLASVIIALVATQYVTANDPRGLAPSQQRQSSTNNLTLQEALRAALKNNLKINIALSARDAVFGNTLLEEGPFNWMFSGEVKVAQSQSFNANQQNQIGLGPVLVSSYNIEDSRQLTLGLKRAFTWGGDLNIQYTPYYDSTRSNQTVKPLTVPYPPSSGNLTTSNPYGGQLSAIYNQPLLQNFGRTANVSRMLVSRNDARIADGSYRKAIIDLVVSVESSYWDLFFAQHNLQNKEASLAIAQKQLEGNRVRVELGAMAGSDLVSNEATISQRRQEILIAKSQLLNAQDALQRTLYPGTSNNSRIVALDEPSDQFEFIDEDAAIEVALKHRLELKMAALDLESKKSAEVSSENKARPQLNAFVGYIGNAATHDRLDSVGADLFAKRYPGYNYGINFSVPIGNSTAKGALITARANRLNSELSLKDSKNDIMLEVRQSYRKLLTSIEVFKGSEEVVRHRQENLETEQIKFENGTTTNFFIIQRQDELDAAAASRLQAKIAVAKAKTDFDKAIGMVLENRKISIE